MSIVDELVKGVIDAVMREVRGKRARRRKRSRTLTPAERLSRIEKLLRPASRRASRRKTTRTRSTAQRRRVAAKTARHRKSLRTGKARR